MMRWIPSHRALTLVMLLALVLPTLTSAQSLADIARQEQARRKQTGKATKTYPNTDLTRDYTASAPSSGDSAADGSTASAASAPAQAAPAASGDAAAADGAAAEPKKDQAYWKGRIDGARATL